MQWMLIPALRPQWTSPAVERKGSPKELVPLATNVAHIKFAHELLFGGRMEALLLTWASITVLQVFNIAKTYKSIS